MIKKSSSANKEKNLFSGNKEKIEFLRELLYSTDETVSVRSWA